ncbi:hypothetical protein EDD21DRAFT_364347 [Dissophora ornata]|nr:hypothetical protein EDD21DRAFT_364347 [Dissophora ornata]
MMLGITTWPSFCVFCGGMPSAILSDLFFKCEVDLKRGLCCASMAFSSCMAAVSPCGSTDGVSCVVEWLSGGMCVCAGAFSRCNGVRGRAKFCMLFGAFHLLFFIDA